MSTQAEVRPPLPPFTRETAAATSTPAVAHFAAYRARPCGSSE